MYYNYCFCCLLCKICCGCRFDGGVLWWDVCEVLYFEGWVGNFGIYFGFGVEGCYWRGFEENDVGFICIVFYLGGILKFWLSIWFI